MQEALKIPLIEKRKGGKKDGIKPSAVKVRKLADLEVAESGFDNFLNDLKIIRGKWTIKKESEFTTAIL